MPNPSSRWDFTVAFPSGYAQPAHFTVAFARGARSGTTGFRTRPVSSSATARRRAERDQSLCHHGDVGRDARRRPSLLLSVVCEPPVRKPQPRPAPAKGCSRRFPPVHRSRPEALSASTQPERYGRQRREGRRKSAYSGHSCHPHPGAGTASRFFLDGHPWVPSRVGQAGTPLEMEWLGGMEGLAGVGAPRSTGLPARAPPRPISSRKGGEPPPNASRLHRPGHCRHRLVAGDVAPGSRRSLCSPSAA